MTWITGDCRNVLPQLDDQGYDLCIADPPYDDIRLINYAIWECRRIAKVSFFFMYADALLKLDEQPDQILFWVKPPSTKNTSKRYSRFVEVICAYDLARSPFNQNTHWSTRSGIFQDTLVSSPRHAYEKPESLIEKLITVNAPPESVILDPFAGSGTVSRVCDRLGHVCTSIEIKHEPAIRL